MKQQITLEQLDEISLENRKKLHNFLRKKYELDRGPFACPNIGEMIEFLAEKRKRDWGILFGKNLAFVATKKGLKGKTPDNRNGELCDGLWEAVKEILEGK
jgi:hypothetical protein